jgi:hypothetical protein
MELRWLEDFLALAEQRTFARAAAVRHINQPAFGRRIRALEEWFGTRLFVRSAQGAVPDIGNSRCRGTIGWRCNRHLSPACRGFFSWRRRA